MSKYDDEGFIYTDTFEELFTELIIDRVYKTKVNRSVKKH